MREILVLGCGDVGFGVANKMKGLGVEPVIIDRDAAKVEMLRSLGYEAIRGDFGSPEVLRKAGIEHAEAVLITTRDFSASKQALKAIKKLETELGIKPVVIARVSDDVEVPEAKQLGASDALQSVQILANSLLKVVYDVKAMVKERQLRALLGELGVGRLAIVLQDEPNLDSLASAEAFKRYAKAFGVDSDIICRWEKFKWSESVFVVSLGLRLIPAEGVKFEDYASFALVGVATHANCALPKDILPTIVIDNHPVPLGEVRARFCDIRPVGATSTLLTNYLKHAAVELDGATAAALAIGILSNTRSFTKGATLADMEALEHLLPLANADLLQRLYKNTEKETDRS